MVATDHTVCTLCSCDSEHTSSDFEESGGFSCRNTPHFAQWMPFIDVGKFRICTDEGKKKSFENEFYVYEHDDVPCTHSVQWRTASGDIVFYYWAVLLSLVHGAENRPECDSTVPLKDRVQCPNTRSPYVCFHDSHIYSRRFIWIECVNYKPTSEIIYRLIL